MTGFSQDEIDGLLNEGSLDDESELDFVDGFSQNYNITIVCETLEEAKMLNERLGLDLDLTRQVLKRKFSDVRL